MRKGQVSKSSTDKYLVIVRPDGSVTKTHVDKAPDLEELQQMVEGYIQLIPYFTTYGGDTCRAYCDEEGKLRDKPYNRTATELWAKAFGHPIVGDRLVGTIVILAGPEKWLQKL